MGLFIKHSKKKKKKEHLEGYALFPSHTGTSNQVYEWREIKCHIHQKGWSNRNSPVPYKIPQIEITSDTDACILSFFLIHIIIKFRKQYHYFILYYFSNHVLKGPIEAKRNNDSSLENSNWMRICLEHLNFKKCETSRNGDL